MAEGAEKGFLTKMFTGAVKVATIGLVAAVAWQCFLDPLFFPLFHDPTNSTAIALRGFVSDYFSWIPELVGLKGSGGLLHTEFANNILSPYYPVAENQISNVFGASGVSLDSL